MHILMIILIMKFFKKLIFSIDLFGTPVRLQQKKYKEYHTLLGAIISLGILSV